MLARKGIFATPSIGIRSRKTAKELKTLWEFCPQNSVYANYSILIIPCQILFMILFPRSYFKRTVNLL